MNKTRKTIFKVKKIIPYEHLEFMVKNTTPYQRLKWLKEAWDFWHDVQKIRERYTPA